MVVTTFDLDEYVRVAITNGASGFLLKDAGPALLAEAVHAAASGDALCRRRSRCASCATSPTKGCGASRSDPIVPLTDREEDIVAAVARGRTNSEIGDELFISLSTVKSHIANIQTKLDARNRVEIAGWAWETGRMR